MNVKYTPWRRIIVIVSLIATHFFSPLSYAQNVQKIRLSVEELQWVLAVADDKWTDEVKSLAKLLEDKQFDDMNIMVDEWLTRDLQGALFSLPALNQFVFRFSHRSYISLFAKHLRRFDGAERMNILAVLGTSNPAVRFVGVRVLIDWWQQDPEGMQKWFKQSSGFDEQSYYEDFFEIVLTDQENYASVASMFFSLSSLDARRVFYFKQIIELWEKENLAAADAYVTSFYGTGSDDDLVLDEAASALGYGYMREENIAKALEWASRISRADIRDWIVSDFSGNISKKSEKQLFLNWAESNPFEIEAALKAFNENLSEIDDETI